MPARAGPLDGRCPVHHWSAGPVPRLSLGPTVGWLNLLRRPREREPVNGVRRAIAVTGVVSSLVATIAVVTPIPPGVRFIAMLIFVCLGPGAAVVCLMRWGDAVVAWAMALILSLSLFALVAVAMVWTAQWHPRPAFIGLALASACACVFALAARGRPAAVPPYQAIVATSSAAGDLIEASSTQTASPTQTASLTQTASAPAPTLGTHSLLTGVLDGAIIAAIVGSWLFSVTKTSTANVGNYGLLFVMHPAFFAAVALCVFGFLRELSRPVRRGWLLVGYTVLLVLVMHATVPMLLPEPEYAWVFPHLGVIDFIRIHGEVTSSTDIYQQWPTFFAAVAQLVTVSGLSALAVAAWTPVFFDLAICVPIYAIARTLTTDTRMPYLTVFLFTSINWLAQDYLAPQAFAYLLSMGLFLIMLRWLRRVPKRLKRRRLVLLARMQAWVQAGTPAVPYTSARTRRTALVALYVVFAVIVSSHQISPYIVVASAAALVVLGLVRYWQLVPILGVITVLYLASRHGAVDQYGLFNGLNFLENAKGNHAGQVEPGGVFSYRVVLTLALGVWMATALGVISSRRRLGSVAVPAALAVAPMAVLFAQSYGGEAINRVFYFSAPWCAYIVAATLLRLRVPSRALRLGLATPALVAVVLASMQGEHGRLVFTQFSVQEVQGVTYLYDHAEPGAWVVIGLGNAPGRLTARYVEFNDGGGNVVLFGDGRNGTVPLPSKVTDEDLKAITAFFYNHRDSPAYLLITSSMKHFANYYGYLPPGALDQVGALLTSSPQWNLWYSNQDVQIYKYQP